MEHSGSLENRKGNSKSGEKPERSRRIWGEKIFQHWLRTQDSVFLGQGYYARFLQFMTLSVVHRIPPSIWQVLPESFLRGSRGAQCQGGDGL